MKEEEKRKVETEKTERILDREESSTKRSKRRKQ